MEGMLFLSKLCITLRVVIVNDKAVILLHVLVQNHWVPVKKTFSPKLKMLGPPCGQTDKRYSFVKHNKDLKKYASLNNSHRNHMNRIFYKNIFRLIDRSIFASYGTCAMNVFRDFYALGMQDAEVTKWLSKHAGLPLRFQVSGCKHLVGGELKKLRGSCS